MTEAGPIPRRAGRYWGNSPGEMGGWAGDAGGPGVACGAGVVRGAGVACCGGLGDCPGLGDAERTSTSAAKKFAPLSKNAADNKTILSMGVYATLCPHFRKINLADLEISGRPPETPPRKYAEAFPPNCFLRDAPAI